MRSFKLKISPELRRELYTPSYPIWKIAAFFAALFGGTVLAFLLFLRPTYSEGEKRNLAAFPAFSLTSLLDGDYFDAIDLWFSDTFPLREEMVSLNAKVQSLYGLRSATVYTDQSNGFDDDDIPDTPAARPDSAADSTTDTDDTTDSDTAVTVPDTTVPTEPEVDEPEAQPQVLGSILVVGNTGYEYYSFSQSAADRYINSVNSVTAALKGRATVYDILVPLSIDITLNDKVRATVSSADQKKAIDYMYSSMDSAVRTVDAYSILRQHRNEYLYFRTDHHWTATGAYYAYCAFAAQKGVSVPKLSDYETMEFGNYLGTLYSKTGKPDALGATPDTVVAYLPRHETTMEFTDTKGKVTPWKVIYDVSNWRQGSQYNTFIGGDNPLTKIENKDLSDGSTCLVVKESFGNAFVPFLTEHYQTVYVIDYRYYKGTVTNFVEQNGVQDVVFINNMSATRSANLMEQLAARAK